VGARLLAAIALASIAAGCGQGASAAPVGPAAVTVTVTKDYGATRIASGREAPGQSALNALRRLTHVGTSYGGRFVESINGLSGDRSAAEDWLYFVNGISPDVGAADVQLHAGDHEWRSATGRSPSCTGTTATAILSWFAVCHARTRSPRHSSTQARPSCVTPRRTR